MKFYLLILITVLTGCTTPVPQPMQKQVTAHINLVASVPSDPSAYGETRIVDGVCVVWLKESTFPTCLAHELMHCFSGNWHPRGDSIAFCRDE